MPNEAGILTEMEKGLNKHFSNAKRTIHQLEEKSKTRHNLILKLLGDDTDKVKEYYIGGDYWIKGYMMTELREYTNKKGKKSMKHYIKTQHGFYYYVNPQPEEDESVLVGGFAIKITEDTYDLFDLQPDNSLVANKERFLRYYMINM